MKVLTVLLLCIVAVFAKKSLIRLPRLGKVSRIIGGEIVNAGEYPFVAVIFKDTVDGRYFCAGALVSDQWVLTAAQCVYEGVRFSIQVGSNQVQSTDSNRLTLETGTYFHEPRFDPTVNLWHDIGLIKFRIPIQLTDYIQPVAIANSAANQLIPGRVVDIIGWGQISDNSDIVNDLRVAQVAIIDQNECQRYYGDALLGSNVCAVGNFNEGICYGDVGGPLFTPGAVFNHSYVNAVGSFLSANGCESLDPTGYTRTDTYYDWIASTIANN